MSTKKEAFVHSGVFQRNNVNCSSIYGYQNVLVVSLQEAVKNIAADVPGVEALASQAKKECFKDNSELTLDESAAIYLYTMPKPFNSKLNEKLRGGNRDELEPWFPFLKMFFTALGKLPSLMTTVWRGVTSDIGYNFVADDVFTWWTVNSCSKDLKTIEFYLNDTGTVFAIETLHGKDIAIYSAIPDEQEVILLPGTRVRLKCDPLEIKNRPFIVSFKEWLVRVKSGGSLHEKPTTKNTGVSKNILSCTFL